MGNAICAHAEFSSTFTEISCNVESIASTSVKSLCNGSERDLLKLRNGLSFDKRRNGAHLILRPLIALIDIDSLNAGAEVVTAAIPLLPPKSVASPNQAVQPALENLCVSVASTEVAIAVDPSAAFALSFQSMEYHYNCSCRGKLSGRVRISRLKLLTIFWKKECDDYRTSISSDIDLEVMLTPKLD
ncbi:hypothetical protein BVRB_027980, partial [Beta vulgaris subsp. vulgaris]